MKILYTIENLEQLLGIPVSTLRLLIREGLLTPYSKMPLRFDKVLIDEYIESGRFERHRQAISNARKGVYGKIK